MSKHTSIKYLKQICDHLATLQTSIVAFEPLFLKEEHAVIEHNIQKLEEACYEKQTRCASLEADVHGLFLLVSDFRKSYFQEEQGVIASSHHSLSDIKNQIEHYQKSIKQSEINLTREIAFAADATDKISQVIAAFVKLKPEIEKNRYIIARLLAHHQQSYQFWNDLHQEVSSNYDKNGSKRNRKTLSQVFAKA